MRLMKRVIRGTFTVESKTDNKSKVGNGGGTGTIYQVKVTLAQSNPPIWRRFLVAGNVQLGTFHEIIQDVMGWTNSHLHEFQTKDRRRYGSKHPEYDFDMDDDLLDEQKALLSAVTPRQGASLSY